jgi:hypothetical protein
VFVGTGRSVGGTFVFVGYCTGGAVVGILVLVGGIYI